MYYFDTPFRHPGLPGMSIEPGPIFSAKAETPKSVEHDVDTRLEALNPELDLAREAIAHEVGAPALASEVVVVTPVVEIAEPTLVEQIVEQSKGTLYGKAGRRFRETRDLMEIRSTARANALEAISVERDTAKSVLRQAKTAREMTIMKHNRLTEFMNKHELKGASIRDLTESEAYQKASRTEKRGMRKTAGQMAATEARKERIDARANARKNIFEARGKIATLKAEKRDLSYLRRNGGTNSYRENFKMTAGGFSVGSVESGILSVEQKQKIANKLKPVRASVHVVRGRKTTKKYSSRPTTVAANRAI